MKSYLSEKTADGGVAERARALARREAAGDRGSAQYGRSWADAGDPLPFEELWYPFVEAAEEEALPYFAGGLKGCLREAMRDLLTQLCDLSALPLRLLLQLYRLRECDIRYGIGKSAEALSAHSAARREYLQMLCPYLASGYQKLWGEYPVLESDVVLFVNTFVDSLKELSARLSEDIPLLCDRFPGLRTETLQSVRTGLSDPHGGRRTVARLDFGGGALYYKPRSVDMQGGFEQFLGWFNGQSHGLPELRRFPSSSRPGYGWARECRHMPCNSRGELEQFYLRAGVLLGLADILSGTDFHMENIVAFGDCPVIVDAETLFHPVMDWERHPDALSRTGLVSGEGMMSELCGFPISPRSPVPLTRWVSRNTIAMDISQAVMEPPPGLNVPRGQDGAPVYAGEYGAAVVAGFRLVHQWHMKHPEIWETGGPLWQIFYGRTGRMIVRDTKEYYKIFKCAGIPGNLLSPERAARAFEKIYPADASGRKMKLYDSERRAIGQFDVPVFYTDTSKTQVTDETGKIVWVLPLSPFQSTKKRALDIGEKELSERIDSLQLILKRGE